MSKKTIIYHNPRCSKSCATLALLTKREEPLDIIHYLDVPPDRETLERILSFLGLQPRDLMRKGEAIYTELSLGNAALTRDELIDAMLEHPILMERPIVVKAGKAAIGRPLESVIDIL
jgi:arsenate reductase